MASRPSSRRACGISPAASSTGSGYGIETKFTQGVRDLAGRFEHRLWLWHLAVPGRPAQMCQNLGDQGGSSMAAMIFKVPRVVAQLVCFNTLLFLGQ
jgi:hypothetical protein